MLVRLKGLTQFKQQFIKDLIYFCRCNVWEWNSTNRNRGVCCRGFKCYIILQLFLCIYSSLVPSVSRISSWISSVHLRWCKRPWEVLCRFQIHYWDQKRKTKPCVSEDLLCYSERLCCVLLCSAAHSD